MRLGRQDGIEAKCRRKIQKSEGGGHIGIKSLMRENVLLLALPKLEEGGGGGGSTGSAVPVAWYQLERNDKIVQLLHFTLAHFN